MEVSMKKYLLPVGIVLLFSFFTIKPLFASGFFPMHDDTQVQRVHEMWVSLKDGMFPVRWVPDLGYGYGYPIFTFYGPLSYYVGGVFVFLTQNALLATKLMFGIGILLAGTTMYFFANSLAGKYVGIIAALLYMYAPYHGVNIYVRGDVAEFFAYAFLPLVFYGLFEYTKNYSRVPLLIGSIGYAGVILSHNLSAMMLTPFIGVFLLYSLMVSYKTNWKKNLWLFFIPFVGVALAAFYWLPALMENGYTNVLSQIGGGSDFRDHFVCISQLWSSPWGYGGSIPGCVDGISLQIGKIQILTFLLGFGFSVWKRRTEGIVLSVMGLLSVFFLLPVSQFIWEGIKPMAFFQFPWRFLLPVSFFFSIVGGLGAGNLIETISKKTAILWTGTVLAGVVIMLYGMKFFVSQTILPKNTADYVGTSFLKWDTSKISDEYMPRNFQKPKDLRYVVEQKITSKMKNPITTSAQSVNYQGYFLKTTSYDLLHFNTAYFPAWHLFINGKEVMYKVVPTGLEYSIVSPGSYVIDLIFQQTLVEKIANSISLIGVLMLAVGIMKKGRHEKNN
jgi:hypothetical protein